MSNETQTITATSSQEMLDTAYDYFSNLFTQPSTAYDQSYLDTHLESFDVELTEVQQLQLHKMTFSKSEQEWMTTMEE